MSDSIIFQDSVNDDKEIPASKRTGSAAYSMALLCKQDKEQLDRIELMLMKIIENRRRNGA